MLVRFKHKEKEKGEAYLPLSTALMLEGYGKGKRVGKIMTNKEYRQLVEDEKKKPKTKEKE